MNARDTVRGENMEIYGNFVRPIGECITGRMSLGTTPKLVAVKDGYPWVGRRNILVALPAESPAATVYFGGPDVTIGTGFPIDAGTGMILPLSTEAGAGKIFMVADCECEVMVAEFIE